LGATPVLLMSGIVNDEVRERAARVKSADVLSKPFAAEELLRRLDALLAKGATVPALLPPTPVALNGNRHVESPAMLTPPPPPAAGPTGSAGLLKQFAAIDGVQWAVLADREGFLLDAAGEGVVDAEVAGALSACLTESSEGLGRELGRGALHGMILEYAQGMVVLYSVGASALLAIALSEPSALGKVRYFAKKSIPELLQAV
jgi:predicted regulator of Ras-like GTPase activity (Roadblock/LC7/MglB family)